MNTEHVSSEMNAVVSQRIELTKGLIILRVVPKDFMIPDFEPGQFAVLGLPAGQRHDGKLIKRAYSIASSPLEREFMEFYIALVPGGELTPRLFRLQPGDELWLSKKIKGSFTLDGVPEDRNILFLATGTGLAPYMSMLRSCITLDASRKFVVVHGARHSFELGYRSELLTMQKFCPNFTYVPVITRPHEEAVPWHGDAGHIQDLWKHQDLEKICGFKANPANTHVFLCGNPAMIEETAEILANEGYRENTRHHPGEIHLERYW